MSIINSTIIKGLSANIDKLLQTIIEDDGNTYIDCDLLCPKPEGVDITTIEWKSRTCNIESNPMNVQIRIDEATKTIPGAISKVELVYNSDNVPVGMLKLMAMRYMCNVSSIYYNDSTDIVGALSTNPFGELNMYQPSNEQKGLIIERLRE